MSNNRTDVLLEEVKGMLKALADGVASNTEAIAGLRLDVGELKVAQERTELRVIGLEKQMTRALDRLDGVETQLGKLRRETDRRFKSLNVN